MRIILVEDDLTEVDRFAKFISSVDGMDLLSTTDSAIKAVELVKTMSPDAVILDLELKEGNGVQFLYDLRELDLPRKPFILVTTWTTARSTLQNMRDNGAGFIQSKAQLGYREDGPRIIVEMLHRLEPYFYLESKNAPKPTPVSGEELDELKRKRIIESIGRIGISPGTNGHILLVEAILVGSKDKTGLVDLENVIYPILMKKFKCTKSAAEKAMRTRIEATWLSTDQECLEREFLQYIDPEKGKPELKQFISYYACKFR